MWWFTRMSNCTLWTKLVLKPVKQFTCEEISTRICFLIGYVEYFYWHKSQHFERNTLLKYVPPKHFLVSKKLSKCSCVGVREKKKVYLYSLCRANDQNHHITFKLRKITLAYYKEIPLMFFVCIPLGFSARFPVQAEILFTCRSY